MTIILAAALAASTTVQPVTDLRVAPAAPRTITAQAIALVNAPQPSAPVISATHAAKAQPGGDSLKNGAIIGGVIAGVGMGAFIYTLCRALDESGGQANCAGPALIWAGIAGAGGAAVGAGIDALFDRQPRFRADVRFRF